MSGTSTPLREWELVIPEEERAVYQSAGYGADIEAGRQPVLLVVDATINFTDVEPKPILESIRTFPNSCGQTAWESLPVIAEVIAAARAAEVPIIYTHGPVEKNPLTLGAWRFSKSRAVETVRDDLGESFPELILPGPTDLVLEKLRPSAFFGTPLASILIDMRRDSVVVCGATTSGCVRATVIDAFSSGYRVVVVEDATFDRSRTSHLVNLFEMNQKYAQVLSAESVIAYFRGLRRILPKPSGC